MYELVDRRFRFMTAPDTSQNSFWLFYSEHFGILANLIGNCLFRVSGYPTIVHEDTPAFYGRLWSAFPTRWRADVHGI